jgi:predicted pyridoxine 5'-phosphate oxidase superfamily flavin-nucleotide-binding protein
MKTQDIHNLLKDREFINVATCDFEGRPNVAPKFILKTDATHIVLIDYVIGRTCANLKINPRISLSMMDLETLTGYQFNGVAEIIEKGAEYEKLIHELTLREISLSAKRIIEGIDSGKKHKSFELAFSDRITIFKVLINEFIEILPHGKLRREEIKS